MRRESFTLAETVLALGVFAIVIVTVSSIFIMVQQSWNKQKNTIELMQNTRWAAEFISNEVRYGCPSEIYALASVDGVWFYVDRNENGEANLRVYYWRGNGASDGDSSNYGDSTYIYRARVGKKDDLDDAYGSRRQLAGLIVDNSDTSPIFNLTSGLLNITLTARPHPSKIDKKGNRNFRLQTATRPRNE